MALSPKEYGQLTKKLSPRSPVGLDCLKAFGIGGTICLIGEICREVFSSVGMKDTDARLTSSAILILLTVILTGVGLFDKIAKHAGAGTLVPITGFANAVVAPAIEYKAEGLILGLGAKMFVIAGPVLVYGITAATLYGGILFIIQQFIR